MKTLPLFVNQFLNYAQQKEPVNINLTAKILGFAEILLKQSYFNTNLTLEHASFALYVVQCKETDSISHHLVSLAELTADAWV